jgi:hypothetical protein
MKITVSCFLFACILTSCQTETAPRKSFEGPTQSIEHKTEAQIKDKGMSNPIMLSAASGSDIGRLFNAYYRTGQVDKMIPLLDSKTKQTYSKEDLRKMLVNLHYGYDMKLSGAQKDGSRYTINYLCQIAQTKVVKQLNVIVEDDTARIVPMNLKAGEIFK